jgi:hypothetical protein
MKHEAISRTRQELQGENENRFFVLWSTFNVLIVGESKAKAGGTQPNDRCRYRGHRLINGATVRPGKFGFRGGWTVPLVNDFSNLWPGKAWQLFERRKKNFCCTLVHMTELWSTLYARSSRACQDLSFELLHDRF